MHKTSSDAWIEYVNINSSLSNLQRETYSYSLVVNNIMSS